MRPLCSATASERLGRIVEALDPVRAARPGDVAVAVDHAGHERRARAVDDRRRPPGSSSPPVGRIQAMRPPSTRMLTLRWIVGERPSARAPSRYRTRPVAGAGVGTRRRRWATAVGAGVGSADGLALEDARGLSDGIGVAQAASPAADAAAPSWSRRRRLIGAGCECIGPLSADASEVRVLEVGRQLQAVAERPVHADVRHQDGAGQRERRDRARTSRWPAARAPSPGCGRGCR